MPPKFYIETLGCQMNVLDSELACSALLQKGMLQADTVASADVILFNTCSVRQHAEDKVYSALGRLKGWKEEQPLRILGVLGCMAQKDQKLVFQRAPHVDFVLGPGRLDILTETIEQLLNARPRPTKTICASLPRATSSHIDVLDSFRLYNPERMILSGQTEEPTLVRIMFGCNQFCSYCVVPFVRGPEQSRSPQEIVNEVQHLTVQGVTKITLIGQTVNSYNYQQSRLADLLYQLSGIAGIEQIDFVTNYPLGIDDDLLCAVRDLPKVSKHFHVPAQSGSDVILKRMNRHYTAAQYREMADRIYGTIPVPKGEKGIQSGATMTSDFIVGFCGETDEDFEQTVELVKYCRFRNSYIFKYSERAGTKAAELYADDVPEDVKKYRNNRLLEVQVEISRQLTEPVA